MQSVTFQSTSSNTRSQDPKEKERLTKLYLNRRETRIPTKEEGRKHIDELDNRLDKIKEYESKVLEEVTSKKKYVGNLEALQVVENNIKIYNRLITAILVQEFKSEVGSFVWQALPQENINSSIAYIKQNVPKRFHKGIDNLLLGLGRKVTN